MARNTPLHIAATGEGTGDELILLCILLAQQGFALPRRIVKRGIVLARRSWNLRPAAAALH